MLVWIIRINNLFNKSGEPKKKKRYYDQCTFTFQMISYVLIIDNKLKHVMKGKKKSITLSLPIAFYPNEKWLKSMISFLWIRMHVWKEAAARNKHTKQAHVKTQFDVFFALNLFQNDSIVKVFRSRWKQQKSTLLQRSMRLTESFTSFLLLCCLFSLSLRFLSCDYDKWVLFFHCVYESI